MKEKNIIPICVVQVHHNSFSDFWSGILQVAQRLHALEGKLNSPTMSVVTEIVLPFQFPFPELRQSFRGLISRHNNPVIHVHAGMNFGEITVDEGVEWLTAQNEPLKGTWYPKDIEPSIQPNLTEPPEMDEALKSYTPLPLEDNYPANIGDCQSPPATDLRKDIKFPTKIELTNEPYYNPSTFDTLQKIVEQLEFCGYVTADQIHPLYMNEAFISLKKMAENERPFRNNTHKMLVSNNVNHMLNSIQHVIQSLDLPIELSFKFKGDKL